MRTKLILVLEQTLNNIKGDKKMILNGSSMLVYSGSGSVESGSWTPIASATNHTLNINQSTRDTSNKTSGKWVTRASGRLDVTGTAEGFSAHSDSFGFEQLMNLVIEREEVKLIFADAISETDSSPSTGSEFYATGSFIFTNFDLSAPLEDNATYNVSFELAAADFGLFNK